MEEGFVDTPEGSAELEERIGQWRTHLLARGAIESADADELEDHLRNHVAALSNAGLTAEEAFLVAVKRIGQQEEVTREFAREHSDRLWKQLVATPAPGGQASIEARAETWVVGGLAIIAAISLKVPELFGLQLDMDAEGGGSFYSRNLSFFVLPCLAAYFAWKRRLDSVTCAWLAATFVVAGVIANAFPFTPQGSTEILAALHLPIALWLPVGIAYAGGRWSDPAARMNFVRFSGELAIYYVLIALGGGMLTGLTVGLFSFIGVDAEWFAREWMLQCGAVGAFIVGAALVELKKSVVENMAPVLTRVFAPMLAALLVALLGTMAWTGNALALERDVLIGFNLLLVLVLCLLIYALSARDSMAPPNWFDGVLLVLVLCALALNAVLLAAMSARIVEYGSSANKLAALGENLILVINLAGSAWIYLQFLRGRQPFVALERWQTAYLSVYAVWAGIVVVVFPPLFGFA